MELVLVRHGEAKTGAKDSLRGLTERGELTVRRVAARVAETGIAVDQIRHSGKCRAQQTAEILARSVNPRQGVVDVPGLGPNDDVELWAADLQQEQDNLMLVGHLPFMGRLAGLLVAGRVGAEGIQFDAGTALCLAREGEHWRVRWVISPPLD